MVSRSMMIATMLVGALLLAPSARCATLLAAGIDQVLYSVDTVAGTVTAIGPHGSVPGSQFYLGGMAFDLSGKLHAISIGTSASLYQVDEATGLASGVGSLGSFLFEGGASVHPVTDQLYVANVGSASNPQLATVDRTTAVMTVVGTIGSGGSHDFGGIAFDDTGTLYGVDRVTNSLWRIDHANPAGSGSTQIGPGLGGGISMGIQGGLTFDFGSGTLYGYASGSQSVITVDRSSGSGTVIMSLAAGMPTFGSLALSGGSCPGSVLAYGAGCVGSGGFVPKLMLKGCPTPAAFVDVEVTQALGGTQVLFFFGLSQGSLPMGSGCTLLVTPLLAPTFAVPVGGSGPGNGSVLLSSQLPAVLPTPLTFTMQVFTIDFGGALGFANSNGLQVTIGT